MMGAWLQSCTSQLPKAVAANVHELLISSENTSCIDAGLERPLVGKCS